MVALQEDARLVPFADWTERLRVGCGNEVVKGCRAMGRQLPVRVPLVVEHLVLETEGGAARLVSDRQALRRNADAFKARLREVGFYRDLSDAYVTQTISPRFPVPA